MEVGIVESQHISTNTVKMLTNQEQTCKEPNLKWSNLNEHFIRDDAKQPNIHLKKVLKIFSCSILFRFLFAMHLLSHPKPPPVVGLRYKVLNGSGFCTFRLSLLKLHVFCLVIIAWLYLQPLESIVWFSVTQRRNSELTGQGHTHKTKGVQTVDKAAQTTRVCGLNTRVLWFEYKIPPIGSNLNTWSPASDTAWEGSGAFRRQNLAGESGSLGIGPEVLQPGLLPRTLCRYSCISRVQI